VKRLLLLLMIGAGPASAQSAGAFMRNPAFADPPPRECITTFDMQHCAAHDLRVADKAMSQAYFAARAHASPAARRRLLADQRRWLAKRDRACIAADRPAGGTIAPVAAARCWVTLTQARARTLRRLR
jgi:uncharacterized protein YecT (DUF1311 family)